MSMIVQDILNGYVETGLFNQVDEDTIMSLDEESTVYLDLPRRTTLDVYINGVYAQSIRLKDKDLTTKIATLVTPLM